ncbi:Xaa-Pro peptidase family protein [Dehalobacter sp. DCM]|uniref:M24 family metallopeptidase n=1 Tax=Dehalobacter sp. DCM TaxID=2907827 RepID=UPI00308179E8|nr:Xaa-Pro peptidase family protein [Dehalobacter sp. DCM]
MRLEKVRQKLNENGLQALLVHSAPNVFYLSGFTGTNATLLVNPHSAYLFTDFRYMEQAEKEAPNFEIVKVTADPYAAIADRVHDISVIGVEEDALTWGEFQKLQQTLTWCHFQNASDIFNKLRQIKDDQEIGLIRKAVEITDLAFAQTVAKIQPGITEEALSLELEYAQRKRGASGRSFDYIVASGIRSSLPHGVATSKKIQNGEFLTVDMGAIYQRYCSDFTRTLFLGEQSSKHHEIYHIVLEAQLAGLTALKPGVKAKDVDAAVREVIAKAGYGDYFGHGLGHSLGLEIHETPSLNTRDETILEAGMVLTVEPGIYIPEWGGVRIEDVALITKSGAEVLTQTTKQCIIID